MEPKKTKILYLITLSVGGGAQKYVFDLANGLDKEKYEIAVAAGGNGELFERLSAAGIKTFKLKWLSRIGGFSNIPSYFEIKKLLKNWQPDVLHLNSSKAGFLGSLAARNLPVKVIYTVHGAVFEAAFSQPVKKILLWLEKWTAKHKHKIICVSKRDCDLWLEHKVAPPEKLSIIHNGINANIDFLSRKEARRKLFAGHTLGTDNYQIVGFVGYFYPEKNLTALIDVASLILNNPKLSDKKILFALIGEGQQENILKSKVHNLKLGDKILFLGAVPESYKYLKAFDLLVLPSVKEGLPYTILEAMAAGLPIVASDVGGIPEMIQDRINGFLIKPRDREALAEKILQILENPDLAQNFGQSSLEKIKEFSLGKMLQQTQEQYQD